MSRSQKSDSSEASDNQVNRVGLLRTIILYPTLAIALIGAIPGYCSAVESFMMKVPLGRSEEAKEQEALWAKNRKCLSEWKQDDYLIASGTDSTVSIALCKLTGDVLIEITSNKNPTESVSKWIASSSIKQTQHAALQFDLLFAQSSQHQEPLIRQRILSQDVCDTNEQKIVQIVRTAVGCFLKVTNPFTGRIIELRPIPCTLDCSSVK